MHMVKRVGENHYLPVLLVVVILLAVAVFRRIRTLSVRHNCHEVDQGYEDPVLIILHFPCTLIDRSTSTSKYNRRLMFCNLPQLIVRCVKHGQST